MNHKDHTNSSRWIEIRLLDDDGAVEMIVEVEDEKFRGEGSAFFHPEDVVRFARGLIEVAEGRQQNVLLERFAHDNALAIPTRGFRVFCRLLGSGGTVRFVVELFQSPYTGCSDEEIGHLKLHLDFSTQYVTPFAQSIQNLAYESRLES